MPLNLCLIGWVKKALHFFKTSPMALFRLSRACRRFQSSAHSISVTQSILFHNPAEPPNPNNNYSCGRSFSNHFINSFKIYDSYIPKAEFPREKFKLRDFNSIRLGYNVGISTWTGEKEDTKKVAPTSWIDLYLPQKTRPYAHLARLDKPIGTWLLAWPCMWSITFAASPGSLPDMKMMTLFGCGAFLLRGAGCTINDLLDRDIDTKVERTRLRPVASGALTPFQGLCFLGLQLFLGLGILLQLNHYSQFLGASSLLLVFTYPLMKRLTFWPQAYLGLTFNWGALLGWAAIRGSFDPAIVFPLYLSGVCWTLVYDTIYAHQDKEDDLKVGVKSTALLFGDSTKEWVGGFGIVCISSLALSGFNADIGWPYYVFLAAASGQLAWQIWTVDLSSRADCNRKFVSNKWFGAIVFSGILVGRLLS